MAHNFVTLNELADRAGLDPSTLRHQIRNGRLAASKVGPVWIVTAREADRYIRDIAGKLGPKGPRKARAA